MQSDNKENTSQEPLQMEVQKPELKHTYKDDLKHGMKDVLHIFKHEKKHPKKGAEESNKNPFEQWNAVIDD